MANRTSGLVGDISETDRGLGALVGSFRSMGNTCASLHFGYFLHRDALGIRCRADTAGQRRRRNRQARQIHIGGAEENTPRAAPHAKRQATSRETSSGSACSRIVGTWSWGYGVTEMTFNQNGTVRQSISGNKGTWTCSGSVVTSVFVTGDRDRITLSRDGNSASVTTTWAGGMTFAVRRRE